MRRVYRSKITRKGQITIAAQARRDTGLNIGDPVDVIVEGCKITVEPAVSWAERTAGIFRDANVKAPSDGREYSQWIEDAWGRAAIERDERSKRRD